MFVLPFLACAGVQADSDSAPAEGGPTACFFECEGSLGTLAGCDYGDYTEATCLELTEGRCVGEPYILEVVSACRCEETCEPEGYGV